MGALNKPDRSIKEDERILDVLTRGLSREFPNPQRVGCPDSAVLRGIAVGKLRLAEVEPWLDHLSSCSPCFQEFTEFRGQAASEHRRTQVWLVAAAVLVFSVAGWLWLRTRPSVQPAQTAVLDLRERSVARGQNPTDTNQPPLEIRSAAKHLILYLPVGSKEGSYDIGLLTESGDQILHATGPAQLENHVVILRADVDVGSVRPGPYFLGIRQHGLEWARFHVRIL